MEEDVVVSVAPMLQRVADWPQSLTSEFSEDELASIRLHARSGRPAGSADFLDQLQGLTGRKLTKGKPGRKSCIK